MSIAPPSDIVLDVAQAADPLKLQAANAKLARMAAGAGGADFTAALDAAAPRSKPLPSSFGTGTTLWRTTPVRQAQAGSTYQKFEAVVLQNFVQSILPKDTNLFGDASSADIVRTMLAEQLATQLAKSGRVGIAKMIEGSHPGSHPTKPPEVPASAPQARIDAASQALMAALAVPSSSTTE